MPIIESLPDNLPGLDGYAYDERTGQFYLDVNFLNKHSKIKDLVAKKHLVFIQV